jgi:hypothetical protein
MLVHAMDGKRRGNCGNKEKNVKALRKAAVDDV